MVNVCLNSVWVPGLRFQTLPEMRSLLIFDIYCPGWFGGVLQFRFQLFSRLCSLSCHRVTIGELGCVTLSTLSHFLPTVRRLVSGCCCLTRCNNQNGSSIAFLRKFLARIEFLENFKFQIFSNIFFITIPAMRPLTAFYPYVGRFRCANWENSLSAMTRVEIPLKNCSRYERIERFSSKI